MSEIRFGIGTAQTVQGPSVVVVVEDRALPLAEIVARHGSPGAVAPVKVNDLLADWIRWHDWLRGLDLSSSSGEGWRPIKAVVFTAPVPEPWNIFQTYHNFTRPSRVTGKHDPSKEERVLPDIFFGSRSALAGYGDTVLREHGGTQFDFEVEITAVIGRRAYRVKGEKWRDHVAGFVIANDYTMHHSWWRPIRRKSPINDNIRMKNFPGYTPVSRAIIPCDLVGDPHDLAVRCSVDGKLRQDTRTNKMLWHIGELVEYLSHIMPLEPGDMIMAGSPEELPLPEGETKGLLPGQTVIAEIEKIGTLKNVIGEQTERQPNEGSYK
jgi:2-keto-4-pentenoate hydratase/2-oxohepta-3-ene-1,7-dioic acid hydratase in catechol pathway